MSDNIKIRPSTATDAVQTAADDVGGVLFQLVKLAFGVDGAAQMVDAAHPFPVTLPDVSGVATQTTLAAVLAKLSADPSTAAKQDTGNASLAALAGLIAGGALATSPTSAGDVVGTLASGRKTVTAAGTAEAIRGSLACKWVQVTALKTNTLQVNTGGAGVSAASGSSTGDPLGPGESVTYPVSNANLVFVDARVNGEGVSFTVGS